MGYIAETHSVIAWEGKTVFLRWRKMRSRIPGVFPQCEERLLMVIGSKQRGRVGVMEMVEHLEGSPGPMREGK